MSAKSTSFLETGLTAMVTLLCSTSYVQSHGSYLASSVHWISKALLAIGVPEVYYRQTFWESSAQLHACLHLFPATRHPLSLKGLHGRPYFI